MSSKNSLQQQLEASKQKRRLASQITVKRTVTHTDNNNNFNNFNKIHKIADANRIQKKSNSDGLAIAGSADANIGQILYNIIGFLRNADEPQTAKDLEENIHVNIYSGSGELYERVTHNPKIIYDEKNETFAYKPEYDIKNKDDLLNLVREQKAMYVKDLKDSYSNLMTAIKELEAEGDILIIYNNKDIPITIYANDKSLNVETDEVFKDLWHSLTVPPAEDLSKELEKAGLKSMEVFETKVNPKNKVKKKSRQRNRKVKILNTHLESFDFTKDYVGENK